MKIGICGIGQFAHNFIPLFNAHPLVEEVVLADLQLERCAEQSAKHNIKRVGVYSTWTGISALKRALEYKVLMVTKNTPG